MNPCAKTIFKHSLSVLKVLRIRMSANGTERLLSLHAFTFNYETLTATYPETGDEVICRLPNKLNRKGTE